jgi:hypothetical protein
MDVEAASQYSWDNSTFADITGHILKTVSSGGQYYCFVKDNYGNE